MSKKIVNRNEVPTQQTWDLMGLFKTEQAYVDQLSQVQKEVTQFAKDYQGTLSTGAQINKALDAMRPLQEQLVQLSTYVSLHSSSDQTNERNSERQGNFQLLQAKMQQELSFLTSEILLNSTTILQQAADENNENKLYLEELIRTQEHMLTPEVDAALAQFSQVLNQPYQTYLQGKLADMKFDSFVVDEVEYPQSFVLFENEWEYDARHAVRRTAYDNFYTKLGTYQNTFASNYQTVVLAQKAMANLKGFDSVIDYLLFDQKVSRDMYDRQIDTIMEKLAPAMRKFANLLKDIHGLDKMTYADLKLPVDDAFEPTISIEESRQYILEGLAPLGDDYLAMVNRAYDERWMDFPQNIGKSTGAFCSSPYGNHPYILISWTERMREVFVLAHELGHAGHFYLAGKNQNIYNTRPSLYFIEAPSTMNELIVARNLVDKADDDRMKRWVYASMISRTYYHNFVTHLLEAAYQREVYRCVDAGKPLSAKVLNDLTLKVTKDFWGDTVEIPDYAGLTWMRQPHYFMGLYPYTYSAGLTIATCASTKLLNNEITINQWKDMLKAGGTKDPVNLAAMVDVDITTSQPLEQTIDYIANMIDEIITLTDKIK